MNTKEEKRIRKKYISDEIGTEYLEWNQAEQASRGEIILITAPTGSGKSHFILYTFLQRVIEEKKKLLYFVNRRILRDQLIEELNKQVKHEMISVFKEPINLKDYISIRTYQSLEEQLKGRETEKAIFGLQKYDYVVYDECHYFFADSNFNTNTELSYDCLRREFDYKVQIFMSATMKNIEEFILSRKPTYFPLYDAFKQISLGDASRIKRYSVPLEYDYIRLFSFEDMEDLIKIINEGEEKWLIFVDSIPFGERLKNKLIDKKNSGKGKADISEEDVAFITAEYKKEEDTRNIVQEIVEKYKSKKRIIISTEVMYNGVSFHDESLINIVIFADTEENFIQMLGRKRMDGYNVNLYLCKRNIEHFRKHRQQAEQVYDFYTSIKNNLENIYKRTFCNERIISTPYAELFYILFSLKRYQSDYACSYQNILPFYEQLIKDQSYYSNYLSYADALIQKLFSFRDIPPYYQWLINYEQILSEQQPILDKVLNNKFGYDNAQKICYSVRGIIAVNDFSIEKCIKQIIFYDDIIKKLEDDENAFLKMQAEWLGKSDEEIDVFIQESGKSMGERYRQKIKKEIAPYLNKNISVDENKNMKLKLKKYFIYFLKSSKDYENGDEQRTKDINSLEKNDRTISIKMFNVCMKLAGLPYEMSKPSDGRGYKGRNNDEGNQNIFRIVDMSASQEAPTEEPEN